jgi:hypothetical protein
MIRINSIDWTFFCLFGDGTTRCRLTFGSYGSLLHSILSVVAKTKLGFVLDEYAQARLLLLLPRPMALAALSIKPPWFWFWLPLTASPACWVKL